MTTTSWRVWRERVFGAGTPESIWTGVFADVLSHAKIDRTAALETFCLDGDQLLADAAWDLWTAYAEDPSCRSMRTAARLIEWWSRPGPPPAVLVLDALSMRELPVLLAAGSKRGVIPHTVLATGAEAPSDTDAFAKALGVSGRATLRGGTPPAGFRLAGAFTEVFERIPFADCQGAIKHDPKVFIWHDLVDAHLGDVRGQSHLDDLVHPTIEGDGFWNFINHLRQGRRVVITGDHGYATKTNARPIDGALGTKMRDIFGGMRLADIDGPLPNGMPPWVAATIDRHHVVVGNRFWRVPGPPKEAYHGGLSLLEIVVPWIEFPAAT